MIPLFATVLRRSNARPKANGGNVESSARERSHLSFFGRGPSFFAAFDAANGRRLPAIGKRRTSLGVFQSCFSHPRSWTEALADAGLLDKSVAEEMDHSAVAAADQQVE